MFDTLVQYRDASSDIEPGLATQWSVSRDGLASTFRLRDGGGVPGGTPPPGPHGGVARAIHPHARQAPNPRAAAPRLVRGTPGVIKGIRAGDARTVQIGLLLPYAPLPAVLAHPAFSLRLGGRPG